ncbi:unnamed protein product [Didymodactylos carnosus]|uniref:Phosphatidate phosphatase APP1 catalytic domain-containing protein n=1 Tax=Didymodactylos carnosus TaxID=1234261 RepID=A0A814PYB0_9BILA|nr:unnamed protein product [Didymodactylos carnosus]CAF1116081.1 unnamed protein product [Didymodactylos carnosus]CAF3876435.1 unnamed protein product [Didymodactylos carnosus]CAF3886446.1 unnamed protein product [Didymodactylos carnosus]
MNAIVCVIVVSIVALSSNGFLFNDKEDIILVPSVAFRDHSPTGQSSGWILHNQGWYYEDNPVQATIMTKALSIGIKNVDKERIRLFTASGEDDKKLCVEGLNRAMCTKTDDEGRIKNTFQMTKEEVQSFIQPGGNGGKVTYTVSTPNKKLQAKGEIYLCDDNGISFISDIDDTIKVTGVTSTAAVLANTFAGEYKSIEKMADAYRYWEKRYNATFSYLTASPDQLYPFLREFLDRENFPSGSAHMRHFTWFDVNFIQFFMSANYIKSKTDTLNMFMKNTKNRQFVLIGDIFQKDPDIYADVYNAYSDRILKIFIRKEQNDDRGIERLEEVFKNVPREKWTAFENGDDLPKDIFV